MRIRAARARGLAAVVCASVLTAAPRTKMTCGTCHRAEAESQPKTEMGTGLLLGEAQAPLKAHPKLTVEENGYTYEIERKGGVSMYTVKNAAGSLTLPIRYAVGVRNLTFVLEYENRYYESLVSYYEENQALGITIGDQRLHPHSLVEAMGRLQTEADLTECFGCHATRAVSKGKLTLDALEPGVKCEHCHEGAEAHLEALANGQTAPVPRKLGQMAAEDMSNFCGQCHRTFETVVGQGVFGERNVRFQPYRLALSNCFLGDDRRIRCTACHNPHEKLVREESSYDRACLKCHAQKQGATMEGATEKACPVGEHNCAGCHMQKMQVPGAASVFTDHFIRILRAGESYPD